MSRSNYSDDLDNWALIRWRDRVVSATRGRRGQKLLTEMLAALDAMPEKTLIACELVTTDGEVCALGQARGLDMSEVDAGEPESVAAAFDVAEALVREIAYWNDEGGGYHETPEHRWTGMRAWVASQIQKERASSPSESREEA